MVEKKNNFDEYKYTVLLVVGSVLVSVILAFIIGKPLYNSLKTTGAELNEKRETLEKLETKLEVLKGLESQKKDLEEKNQVVLAAIPTDKDISRLFYQFEKIAESSGLKIESVSESTESANAQSETNTMTVIPVSYEVTASTDSYNKFKAALKNFETSLRILSIDSITISGEPNSLNINLTINTYKRG